jgi:hypothetical protein
MRLAFAFLALISLAVPARAQMRDNRDTELSCSDSNRDRPRVCEVHESRLGPSGTLELEPGHNGGITVKGWSQNSVLVRARLEAWAENDAEARALASQIRIDTAGGRIRATGPDFNGSQGWWGQERRWTVSLEVFTPWNTDLRAGSHNGGLSFSDIRGRINFQTHNGGVRLTRVAGDINGQTHNGGIQVELEGTTYQGRQLEVSTHNGGITLALPASFSASFETQTNRGRLDSDFPVNVRGRLDERQLNFSIGSGGPLIKVNTHNGGIRLRRM